MTVRDKNTELMENTLIPFYRHDHNLRQMLQVLDKNSKISLRVLDWFVTNYAKQYDTVYPILRPRGHTAHFFVYSEYKSLLRGYSKKLFDPFCRRNRIMFEYEDTQISILGHETKVKASIITTIAQLNFFKWAIENKVVDYVSDHLDEIINDMNLRGSKARKEEDEAPASRRAPVEAPVEAPSEAVAPSSQEALVTKAKKKELSVSAAKRITQHDIVVTVQFH